MITIEFQIPKKTPNTQTYKQSFDLGVNARVIKSIEVVIPEGHKGLVYLRIMIPGAVLIPAPGSSVQYMRGENTTSKSSVNKRVEGPPYYLLCEGYNEDPFLSHAFVINIEV